SSPPPLNGKVPAGVPFERQSWGGRNGSLKEVRQKASDPRVPTSAMSKPQSPGQRSPRSSVPGAVPSLAQTSYPVLGSKAVKKSFPPAAWKPMGKEDSGPSPPGAT